MQIWVARCIFNLSVYFCSNYRLIFTIKQDVSAKTGFSIIRKAETSNLTVGANGITLKKPSIDGYIVIGLVGARVDTAQNILVKGFDGASGYVAIQNNSTADSHTISGSWLIQRKP